MRESEVAETPSDLMDCTLLGSSVQGIFQARVLEWAAIAFSVSRVGRIAVVSQLAWLLRG